MQIIVALLVVLVIVVIATAKFKIHPFFSLLVAAILIGFFLGFEGTEVLNLITEGFGNTLAGIGIIIALGATIGILLEKSRGTKTIANSLLKIIGIKRSLLAINFTGILISIPVFCDSAFILLASINKALSRKTGISLVAFGISLAAGLYAAHVFIPPTPGPLAAAAILDANLGLVILYGLMVSIPVALSGYLWAIFISKKIKRMPQDVLPEDQQEQEYPGLINSLLPILLPILLITGKSLAEYPSYPLGEGMTFSLIRFVGDPIIALGVGVIFSFMLTRKFKKEQQLNWIGIALKDAGVIILITGMGGAFGNILRASDLSSLFSDGTGFFSVGLLLSFSIAALLKTAQGSSTVAIITASAIIAPLAEGIGLGSATGRALSVLAIGAGAMTVSHVNDSFFWVVAKFTEMDMNTALKTQTMSTLIQGITGLLVVLLLSIWLL